MPVLSLVVAFMNISLLGHLMCLVACAFWNHILSVWRVLLRIQRCNFNLWIIFLCLVLQELFFKYSWNNFLHTQVEKCITTVLNNPPTEEDGEQCTPLVDVVSLLVILAYFCSCEVYLVASLDAFVCIVIKGYKDQKFVWEYEVQFPKIQIIVMAIVITWANAVLSSNSGTVYCSLCCYHRCSSGSE